MSITSSCTNHKPKAGTIHAIRVKNFMIYRNAEIYPSPALNFIIGPNGTGKSSIMCAICLGLAGKLNTIGRAAKACDYIKNGFNDGHIEIELHGDTDDRYVIRRNLTRSSSKSSSSWFINGKPESLHRVEQLVKSLHIDINNPCQFLPQEKVADFAKMTPEQLLVSTELSIGSTVLYETHEKLKSDISSATNLMRNLSSFEQNIESDKRLNAAMEQEIRGFEERQSNLQMIKVLEAKKPRIEHSQTKNELDRVLVIRESKQKDRDRLNSELAPLKSRHEESKKICSSLQAQIKSKESDLKKSLDSQSLNENVDKESEKISELKSSLQFKKKQEEVRLKRVEEMKQRIGHLNEENVKSLSENIQPEMERIHKEMKDISGKMTERLSIGRSIQSSVNSFEKSLKSTEAELKALNDLNNSRLMLLKQRDHQVYKAVVWLRSNKHRFNAEIHEPMFLTLNVSNVKYAQYAEMQISWRDIIAFICENQEDVKHLQKLLISELKVHVNIVLKPSQSAFHPSRPLSYFTQYGFYTYLREVLMVNEATMRFLCKLYFVHDILIGDERVERQVDRVIADNPQLKRFYTTSKLYAVKHSRYSKNVSVRSDKLKEPTFLCIAINYEKVSSLENEVEKFRELRALEVKKYKDLQQESKQFENALIKLRNEKSELRKKKEKQQTLSVEIEDLKNALSRKERESIDLEKERSDVASSTLYHVKRKIHLLSNSHLIANIRHRSVRRISIMTLVGKLIDSESSCSTLTRSLEERSKTVDSVEESLRELDTSINDLKTKLQTLRLEVKKTRLSQDEEQLLQNTPDVIEEIDSLISMHQLRADSVILTDQRKIDDYYARASSIQRMEEQITLLSEEMSNLSRNRQELRDRWLTPLRELIKKIDEHFSHFLSLLRCAGEVVLHTPANIEDYSKYGIKIRVKYRDNDVLKDLNAQTQSGGERSVAIILYLMSLQELALCPFRCADEINQGMDHINERKVLQCIFETVCQRTTSQYFLMSPKLLPGLSFPKNVKVHHNFCSKRLSDARKSLPCTENSFVSSSIQCVQ